MNDGSENYNSCCIGRRTEKKGPRLSLAQGAGSKNKRHFPSASLSGGSTNLPTAQLKTALVDRTQGYVAHFWKNHHRILLSYWNVLIFTGNELELVEDIKKYHLDIVRVSFTKRRCSGNVDLDGRSIFFLFRC